MYTVTKPGCRLDMGKGHSGEQGRCRLELGIQPEKASDLIQTQYMKGRRSPGRGGLHIRGLTHLGLWQVKAALQSSRAVQTGCSTCKEGSAVVSAWDDACEYLTDRPQPPSRLLAH